MCYCYAYMFLSGFYGSHQNIKEMRKIVTQLCLKALWLVKKRENGDFVLMYFKPLRECSSPSFLFCLPHCFMFYCIPCPYDELKL